MPSKQALVSVFDHGFLYGDGIYETMRVYDGVIFKLDEHIKRLYRSASLIRLKIPHRTDFLKISLYETLIANNLKNAYLRLTISRGKGELGLDPELCEKPTVVIIAKKFNEYPQKLYKNGIKIIISNTKRNSKEAINPQIKSLNFLNNILAKMEAKYHRAYEAIMLNTKNELTEGTISNVFFYKNGVLCTPSVECGILDGITRKTIIDIARRNNMKVKEGSFTKEDIYSSQEVFITNTTLEIMPVSRIDKYRYKVGEISKSLHNLYKQEVCAYVSHIKAKGNLIG